MNLLPAAALIGISLVAGFPEIDSLQRKGVWAIEIGEQNVAYVYSAKRSIGSACVTTAVAYIKTGRKRWHVEEAAPQTRLALKACAIAKPGEFTFDVESDVDLERLKMALPSLTTEIITEPHRSRIEGKEPFRISGSGNEISFSWMGPALHVVELRWKSEDSSLTAGQYQEEVESIEMNQ